MSRAANATPAAAVAALPVPEPSGAIASLAVIETLGRPSASRASAFISG
ncbi:MAG: hypothetical protein M3478_00630 [Planctomycetota bacterium]|nr:hypothetical protein [Planctomycetota bacterium]